MYERIIITFLVMNAWIMVSICYCNITWHTLHCSSVVISKTLLIFTSSSQGEGVLRISSDGDDRKFFGGFEMFDFGIFSRRKFCGGVCCRAVNTLHSGSWGPWFKPRLSRCFLRQGTLLHFVSTQVYKWVLGTYCWGVTLQCTSIPSCGGSNTPWYASC